jgi:hypothetical protein
MERHVYIAASWKHQLAVELLSKELRAAGVVVNSFVDNRHGEQKGHEALTPEGKCIPFDEWVMSEQGKASFDYDARSACTAQLVIYIGPSGCDTWAEVGMAWAREIRVIGFWAKGEQAGLFRRCVGWYTEMPALLAAVRRYLGLAEESA